jgi:hypothetical protein
MADQVHFHVWNKDFGSLHEIEDETIDVVITSPPYNLGHGTTDWPDVRSRKEFERMLRAVVAASKRVLKPNGHFVIDVAHWVQDKCDGKMLLAEFVHQTALDEGLIEVNRKSYYSVEFENETNKDRLHSAEQQVLVFAKKRNSIVNLNLGEKYGFGKDGVEWHWPPTLVRDLFTELKLDGKTVLDPFGGSCRIGREVAKSGGTFFGYEASGAQFSEHVLSLFGPAQEKNSYPRVSAFQAVYFGVFLFAIISLWLTAWPEIWNWIVDPSRGISDQRLFFCLLASLLFFVSVHWTRLYITLEMMEDRLLRGDAGLFSNWSNEQRFVEFVLRCGIVFLIGWKAVQPADASKLPLLFLLLTIQYAGMVVWGVFYLEATLMRGSQKLPKRSDKLRFAARDCYLALSLPAFVAFLALTVLAGPKHPKPDVLAISSCVVVICLGLAIHLIWDAYRDTASPLFDWPRTENKPFRNWRGYFQWIWNQLGGEEANLIMVSAAAILIVPYLDRVNYLKTQLWGEKITILVLIVLIVAPVARILATTKIVSSNVFHWRSANNSLQTLPIYVCFLGAAITAFSLTQPSKLICSFLAVAQFGIGFWLFRSGRSNASDLPTQQ